MHISSYIGKESYWMFDMRFHDLYFYFDVVYLLFKMTRFLLGHKAHTTSFFFFFSYKMQVLSYGWDYK